MKRRIALTALGLAFGIWEAIYIFDIEVPAVAAVFAAMFLTATIWFWQRNSTKAAVWMLALFAFEAVVAPSLKPAQPIPAQVRRNGVEPGLYRRLRFEGSCFEIEPHKALLHDVVRGRLVSQVAKDEGKKSLAMALDQLVECQIFACDERLKQRQVWVHGTNQGASSNACWAMRSNVAPCSGVRCARISKR